jgi:hypothetical protein
MRKLLVVTSLFLSLAGAAAAEKYMLIWQSGETPNRCAFYADMESALPQGEVRPLTVVEIYENDQGPYASKFVCEFRASDRQCRLVKATDFFRDNERQKDYSHDTWQSIPNNWQYRAFDFATQDQAWRAAFQTDLQQEKLTGIPKQSALVSQGYLYAGQHWWPSALDAFTYKHFWTNAKRPEFTSSKPKDVQAREKAEVLSYLEQISNRLGGFVESGQAQLQQVERQRQIDQIKAQCAQRRPYTRLNGQLDGWIGITEKALVAQEGNPSQFKVDKGVRCLTYRNQRSADLMQIQNNGSIQKVGQNDYYIDITYFVVDGVIIDFVVSGNDPSL